MGHDSAMTGGAVKSSSNDISYTFVAPESGGEAFVHISAVERAGMPTLNKGQRVTCEFETDRRGEASAVNLPET